MFLYCELFWYLMVNVNIHFFGSTTAWCFSFVISPSVTNTVSWHAERKLFSERWWALDSRVGSFTEPLMCSYSHMLAPFDLFLLKKKNRMCWSGSCCDCEGFEEAIREWLKSSLDQVVLGDMELTFMNPSVGMNKHDQLPEIIFNVRWHFHFKESDRMG